MIHLRTPMLFALGFITMFTLGGISGIMLAVIPFDIHVSDTYFVVAHIHYVLFGGSVFTIFAGIYHWFPKMTGRMYDETLGKLHFWLSFIFFNLTFGPMHLVGVDGMPRRVADYADQFATLNAIISISAFLFGLSFLVFVYNMIASLAARPAAPATRGARTRSSGRCPRRRRSSTSTRSRRSSAAPTSTACPGAVHAVFKEKAPASAAVPAPAGGGGAPPPTDMKRILVVANETVAGKPLIDAVQAARRRRRGRGPRDLPAEPAQARLRDLRRRRSATPPRTGSQMTLALLREAGIEADGEVMDPDPYAAMMDALGEHEYDEIIISTHPETRSGWLREDLVDRVRRAARRPVEHVVVDLDAERDDVKRTLVVANQTVGGRALIDLLREQGRRGAAPLHRDLPAGRRQRRRRATTPPRAARAHAQGARGRGPRGDRAGGPPRPVHRDPERAPVLRAGRHRDLDLPRDALRLAARRPDRPRAARPPASRSSTWSSRGGAA